MENNKLTTFEKVMSVDILAAIIGIAVWVIQHKSDGVEYQKITGMTVKEFVYTYPIEITRVVDGDTVIANINMGIGIIMVDQRLRLLGYDAYEKKTEKGKEATKFAEEILLDSDCLFVTSGKRDNFGRPLGNIQVNGKIFGELLKENGFLKEEEN